MSSIRTELLIDHLDSSLQGKGSPETEQLIRSDRATGEEWRYLHIAVDAIRDAGLHEQVLAMRKEWETQLTVSIATHTPKAKVFTMYRQVSVRIAACILILSGGAAIYKYSTTNSAAIYREYYSSYELNTSRGVSTADPIELAYNDKNWAGVISLTDAVSNKNNKTTFFDPGMASNT